MLKVSTLTIKPLMNLSDLEPTIYHARGEHTNGPLPKWCPAVALSRQDGHNSAVALLLKAALIQVSDYRLLGTSGIVSVLTSTAILVRGRDHQTQIWFSGFREDLNVIFYQNMPNLHNRYKSAERKISKKNPRT
jgi:hypothetical protein